MLQAMAAADGVVALYNLDGETITDADPVLPIAGLRINTDGTVDKNVGGSYLQIDVATDWILPNALAATIKHWVRFERISGDSGNFGGTLSTWIQCSGSGGSSRYIGYSGEGVGVYSTEIALDSGGSNIVVGPVNYPINAVPFG